MHMLQLSAELLQSIATYLRQVDLLNLSLTCKYLQAVTEPALFFHYRTTETRSRSLLSFITRILRKPELAKHVRVLELNSWETIENFNPHFREDISDGWTEIEEDAQSDRSRNMEPSQEDYSMLTEAAQVAGVITEIFPYEHESYLVTTAQETDSDDFDEPDSWFTYTLDEDIAFSALSYDRKFCQLLRAGVEDPLVVLLVALLPRVKEIFLHGTPHDIKTLPWRAKHEFKELRRVMACPTDDMLTWPIAFFEPVFVDGKLEVFQASKASSWYLDNGDLVWPEDKIRPLRSHLGTLHLKILQLYCCCLQSSDLTTLITACPGLEKFHYTTGTDKVGPWSPSPGKFIELLAPVQHTLTELYLILDPENYEDIEPSNPDLIVSLAHMKALKCVCTTPGMWHAVEEENYNSLKDTDLPFERRLSFRLPQCLVHFILELSEFEDETSLDQIEDIIRMRLELLPNLTHIILGSKRDYYFEDVTELVEREQELMESGPHKLHICVGEVGFESVFENMTQSALLTQWTGRKYSMHHRPLTNEDRERKAVVERLMREDPELKALVKDFLANAREDGHHEYSDED